MIGMNLRQRKVFKLFCFGTFTAVDLICLKQWISRLMVWYLSPLPLCITTIILSIAHVGITWSKQSLLPKKWPGKAPKFSRTQVEWGKAQTIQPSAS